MGENMGDENNSDRIHDLYDGYSNVTTNNESDSTYFPPKEYEEDFENDITDESDETEENETRTIIDEMALSRFIDDSLSKLYEDINKTDISTNESKVGPEIAESDYILPYFYTIFWNQENNESYQLPEYFDEEVYEEDFDILIYTDDHKADTSSSSIDLNDFESPNVTEEDINEPKNDDINRTDTAILKFNKSDLITDLVTIDTDSFNNDTTYVLPKYFIEEGHEAEESDHDDKLTIVALDESDSSNNNITYILPKFTIREESEEENNENEDEHSSNKSVGEFVSHNKRNWDKDI